MSGGGLSLPPMFILALDTSMAACSAAVYDSKAGLVLAEAYEPMERGHAERLAPMVDEVMRRSGIAFSQLNRIGVTVGPGTFTGVRIALSLARGFGVALSIPVTGLNSLRAIAANAPGVPVAIAVDARNDELYAASYDAAGAELVAPSLIHRSEADKLCAGAAQVLGTGFAAVTLPHTVQGDFPRASQFAPLVAALDPELAKPEPLYLRQPDIKPQYEVQKLTGKMRLAAALLADMHAESFDEPWDQASFSELLASPQSEALVIVHNGDPSGFVLFRRAADEAEVITIGIRPSFRRKGLGRALVGEMEKALLSHGTTQLFLEVAQSNAAARALYRRAGFHEAGRRKNYYQRAAGQTEDALVLRKAL